MNKHEHKFIQQTDTTQDKNGGFHIFEFHVDTIKYGIVSILLFGFALVAGYFLWRRCRRGVQRRHWRRLFTPQYFSPSSLFGIRAPPQARAPVILPADNINNYVAAAPPPVSLPPRHVHFAGQAGNHAVSSQGNNCSGSSNVGAPSAPPAVQEMYNMGDLPLAI